MQEFEKHQNQNSLNLNIPETKKIALQIKAWSDLFAPGAPDVRLKEAESVAKFSNFFELLSSVSCAGLDIEEVFDVRTKEEKMFMEWFKAFKEKNEKKFFDKYLS